MVQYICTLFDVRLLNAKEYIIKTLIIIILLLTGLTSAHAASIYRCINAEGVAEFTEEPCGKNAEQVDITKPRGKTGISIAPNSAKKDIAEILKDNQQLEDTDSKEVGEKRICHPLQSFKLRRMIVQKKLARCMTKDNVRTVFDRSPNSIHYDSNGEETWYYRFSEQDRTYVFFNTDGLVRNWTGPR